MIDANTLKLQGTIAQDGAGSITSTNHSAMTVWSACDDKAPDHMRRGPIVSDGKNVCALEVCIRLTVHCLPACLLVAHVIEFALVKQLTTEAEDVRLTLHKFDPKQRFKFVSSTDLVGPMKM